MWLALNKIHRNDEPYIALYEKNTLKKSIKKKTKKHTRNTLPKLS